MLRAVLEYLDAVQLLLWYSIESQESVQGSHMMHPVVHRLVEQQSNSHPTFGAKSSTALFHDRVVDKRTSNQSTKKF